MDKKLFSRKFYILFVLLLLSLLLANRSDQILANELKTQNGFVRAGSVDGGIIFSQPVGIAGGSGVTGGTVGEPLPGWPQVLFVGGGVLPGQRRRPGWGWGK